MGRHFLLVLCLLPALCHATAPATPTTQGPHGEESVGDSKWGGAGLGCISPEGEAPCGGIRSPVVVTSVDGPAAGGGVPDHRASPFRRPPPTGGCLPRGPFAHTAHAVVRQPPPLPCPPSLSHTFPPFSGGSPPPPHYRTGHLSLGGPARHSRRRVGVNLVFSVGLFVVGVVGGGCAAGSRGRPP